jgi:hypothetical protein
MKISGRKKEKWECVQRKYTMKHGVRKTSED